MTIHAQQTNYHFSHSISTTATPEKIWQIWTDVPNWTLWDAGIKLARLEGVFKENATGELVPDKGPRSKFSIKDVIENKSYTIQISIPSGWLLIHRYMEQKDGILLLTHEVQFTGFLRKLSGYTSGKRYRQMLPAVMEKLNAIAQTKN